MKNTIITSVLIAVIIVLSGYSIYKKWFEPAAGTDVEKISRLQKLEGKQQLILAKQEYYREYIHKVRSFPDNGEVLIRWMVKFEFIADFKKYPVQIEKSGTVLKVICPPIELNDPQVDLSQYRQLILNNSIVRNLQGVINTETATLQSKSLDFGRTLLNDPVIKELCRKEMENFIFPMVNKNDIKFDELRIIFK